MSGWTFVEYEGDRLAARRGIRLLTARALPGIAILASSAMFGTWMAYLRPAEAPIAALPQLASEAPAQSPYGKLTFEPTTFAELTVSDVAGPVSEPSHSLTTSRPILGPLAIEGSAPSDWWLPSDPYGQLAELHPTASLRSGLDLDLDIGGAPAPAETQVATGPAVVAPLPPRRPAGLGAAPPSAEPQAAVASREPNAQNNAPGFFERLLGALHPSQGAQGQAVAYASPETTSMARSTPQNAILRSVAPWGQPSALARYDKFTAVYDIEAKTVYLPNGTRLEAHSGLGDRKDDPKFVNERARGATPPDLYELSLREGSFHGVQALRLKPLGSGDPFGRTGLLAHPYMLGAEGDSFGCVSFKDYEAFLQAFQTGQVKKLAVVSKLD